jgi:hypothetical protein
MGDRLQIVAPVFYHEGHEAKITKSTKNKRGLVSRFNKRNVAFGKSH